METSKEKKKTEKSVKSKRDAKTQTAGKKK